MVRIWTPLHLRPYVEPSRAKPKVGRMKVPAVR